jgi:HSP20 family protein
MNLTLFRRRPPLSTVTSNSGLVRLRDDMDRAFDQFLSEPFSPFGGFVPALLRSGSWIPPLDVTENDGEVTIRAEVPGIAARDLDISVSGTTLTLAGQKEESAEKKEKDFYQCERRFGSFRRVIDLPETVDADKVTAESDNGVVTIHIAKKPGVKPRQVEVKPAAGTGKKVPVTG